MKTKIKTILGKVGEVDEVVNSFIKDKRVHDIKQTQVTINGKHFLSILILYKVKRK